MMPMRERRRPTSIVVAPTAPTAGIGNVDGVVVAAIAMRPPFRADVDAGFALLLRFRDRDALLVVRRHVLEQSRRPLLLVADVPVGVYLRLQRAVQPQSPGGVVPDGGFGGGRRRRSREMARRCDAQELDEGRRRGGTRRYDRGHRVEEETAEAGVAHLCFYFLYV
jgi:hypothetical protein